MDILKLLENSDNRNAYFKEAYAFCKYGCEPVVFTSITKGTIAKEKSGTYGWSWDFIFVPEGSDRTLGCFEDDIRFSFWNTDGLKKLEEYLKNNM